MQRRHYLVVPLAVAALAIFAGSAKAHTTVLSANPIYQRFVDEAKMPTPDVTLEVEETSICPAREAFPYPACTSPAEGIIWINPAGDTRHTFLHELGHNVDADLLSEGQRAHYMAIMGLSAPWHPEGEPAPFGPSEWFAESYAECAVKPHIPSSARTQLGRGPIFGGQPLGGIAAHNATCRMLAKL